MVGVIATVVESTVVANGAGAATKTTKRPTKTTKAPAKAATTKPSATAKTATTKPGAGVLETKVQVLPVPQVVIDDLALYVGGVWRGNWLDRQGRKGVSTM